MLFSFISFLQFVHNALNLRKKTFLARLRKNGSNRFSKFVAFSISVYKSRQSLLGTDWDQISRRILQRFDFRFQLSLSLLGGKRDEQVFQVHCFLHLCQGNPCLALIETKFHEEYFKRFDFHLQWGDRMISVQKSCVAQSDKKLRKGVDDNLWKLQNLKIFLTNGAHILFLYSQSGKKSREGVEDNLQ